MNFTAYMVVAARGTAGAAAATLLDLTAASEPPAPPSPDPSATPEPLSAEPSPSLASGLGPVLPSPAGLCCAAVAPPVDVATAEPGVPPSEPSAARDDGALGFPDSMRSEPSPVSMPAAEPGYTDPHAAGSLGCFDFARNTAASSTIS